MNKLKLQDYDLQASVHTFVLRSSSAPLIPENIGSEVAQTAYFSKSDSWLTTINPNKLEYGDLFTYSEFNAAVHDLIDIMEVPDSTYYRVDIRLDSYEENFQSYLKLNMLLTNLFSILYNDPNRQAVAYMLTQEKVFSGVSTQNQYRQVEYYDKKFQTNDEDPAKARLEFRCLKSKKQNGFPPHEFKNELFKRLDELPKHYDELQLACNHRMYKAYLTHCKEAGRISGKEDRATEFLSHYHNNMTMFTRKQLEQFLEMCGINDSRGVYRADYITKSYQLEYFSMPDLQNYIKKLKESMNEFFEN